MGISTQQDGLDIEVIVRPSPDSYRILHVDDDPALTDLTSTFLEREQELFEVISETSAADGIDRLEADDLDCIISDYDMPGMDGLEFLQKVRTQYPDLPFIRPC